MTLFRQLESQIENVLENGLTSVMNQSINAEISLQCKCSRWNDRIEETLKQCRRIASVDEYGPDYIREIHNLREKMSEKIKKTVEDLHALKVYYAESVEASIVRLNNLLENQIVVNTPETRNVIFDKSQINTYRHDLQKAKQEFLSIQKLQREWMINFHQQVKNFRDVLLSDTSVFRREMLQLKRDIKAEDSRMQKEIREWRMRLRNCSWESPTKPPNLSTQAAVQVPLYSTELDSLKQQLRKERDKASEIYSKERMKYVELFKAAHDKIALAARETTELSRELFMARQAHANEVLALQSDFSIELENLRNSMPDIIKARETQAQLLIQRRKLLQESGALDLEREFATASENSRLRVEHTKRKLDGERINAETNTAQKHMSEMKRIEAEFSTRAIAMEYEEMYQKMTLNLEKLESEIDSLESQRCTDELTQLKTERDELVQRHVLERKEIVTNWKAEMSREEERHRKATRYPAKETGYSPLDGEIANLRDELLNLESADHNIQPPEDDFHDVKSLKHQLELETKIQAEALEIAKSEKQKVIVSEKIRIRGEIEALERELEQERTYVATSVCRLFSPNRDERLVYLIEEDHRIAKEASIRRFEAARTFLNERIREIRRINSGYSPEMNKELKELRRQLESTRHDIRYEAEKAVRSRDLDDMKRQSMKTDSKRIELLEFKAQLLSTQLTPLMEELNTLRKRTGRQGTKSACAVKKPVARAQSQLKNPSGKNIIVSRCHSRINKPM